MRLYKTIGFVRIPDGTVTLKEYEYIRSNKDIAKMIGGRIWQWAVSVIIAVLAALNLLFFVLSV